MTGIDLWLQQASRRLSRESAAQVESEIRAHYESAREASLSSGASPEQADRSALAALGDPKAANCEYRKTLLTKAEARMFAQGSWETATVCANRRVRVVAFSIPGLFLIAAAVCFFFRAFDIVGMLSRAGIDLAALFLLYFLPVHTPSRSRLARYARWLLLAALPFIVLGSDTLRLGWLFIGPVWAVASTEWTRASIRRKLPISRWPRHLYL